jgi:small subunit ribosomal protein S17
MKKETVKTKTIKQAKRKRLQGYVVKLSAINTVKVEIEIKAKHPKYKKVIVGHKDFLVHCLDKDIKIGDTVLIEEGRPMSKNKCFYLVKKI